MYKCEHTGKTIEPGIPQNRVVVEKRKRVYEKRIKRGRNKGTVELVEGWEIAKEIVVGPEAYRELTGQEPAQAQRASPLVKDARVVEDTRPVRRKKPWQNPSKKGTSKHSGSRKSHSSKTHQTQTAESKPKGPVVERVNRLPVKNSTRHGSKPSNKKGKPSTSS